MWFHKQFCFSIILVSFLLFGFGLSKDIQKRVNKEIEKTFESSTKSSTIEMLPVIIPEEINRKLPTKITGTNLFTLSEGSERSRWFGELTVPAGMGASAGRNSSGRSRDRRAPVSSGCPGRSCSSGAFSGRPQAMPGERADSSRWRW